MIKVLRISTATATAVLVFYEFGVIAVALFAIASQLFAVFIRRRCA
jgi:hypothetical protein